jgi:hypothetical protein
MYTTGANSCLCRFHRNYGGLLPKLQGPKIDL